MATLQELIQQYTSDSSSGGASVTPEEGQAILSRGLMLGASVEDLAALSGVSVAEINEYISANNLNNSLPTAGSPEDTYEPPVVVDNSNQNVGTTTTTDTTNTAGTVTQTPATQTPATQTPTTTTTTPTVNTNTTIPITARSASGINNPSAVPAGDRGDLARQGMADIASGNVMLPGADLAAVTIPEQGTITSGSEVQQINVTPTVATPTQITTPVIDATNQAVTTTAQQQEQLQAQTVDAISQVGDINATAAAQGQMSTGAVAGTVNAQIAPEGQATTVEVNQVPGATVEAVTGQMPAEAIAEAAKVAGLEAARVDRAKQQLRVAGLSEAQIATFGNDPSALEMELTNFTEEQRGVVAGLPEEALVSTQMAQLLEGLDQGDVPVWAKPAVTSVEQMLTRRGINVSTIARDALVNTIIQASLPIAQSNAQAIKESALQQQQIIASAAQAEAQFKQQATLQNAQNVFNLNLRNLDAEQQAELANSQFLQTVSLTNADNKQKTAIQNAINATQVQVEGLEANSQIAINNARNFLQMDLTNLSNAQQAVVIDQQFKQQQMLSNAAAENARQQFNASSENQLNQFMTNLAASIEQFNTQQLNAMRQFNITEQNRVNALNAGNQLQAQQFNAQLRTQVDQFNAQQELAVEQWNAANAQAIEQSNIQWRRQANTANTAAQNAINQQNVQNAFQLTAQAQAALWQELRDAAMFTFQAYENKEDREAQLYATAIGNESAASNSYDHTSHLVTLARSFFGG